MIFGTVAAYRVSSPTASHWAGSVDTLFGHTVYIGLSAVILNLAVSVILTLVFEAARVPGGADETLPHEYKADPPKPPPRFRSASAPREQPETFPWTSGARRGRLARPGGLSAGGALPPWPTKRPAGKGPGWTGCPPTRGA
jgi:hypothetical protein